MSQPQMARMDAARTQVNHTGIQPRRFKCAAE